MNSGTGRFGFASKGKTGIVYIPANIVRDSAFPLQKGDVKIRIEKKRIVVEKAEH